MKKLTITTKHQADKILVESLFKPVNGRTLRRFRFDSAKYKPELSCIGRELDVDEHIFAVWPEHRKDSDGPYTRLMCLTSRD